MPSTFATTQPAIANHTIRVPLAALTRTEGLWDHCTTAVYSPRANAVTFTRLDDCP